MAGQFELPEGLLTEIYRCFRCGYCRSACPTFAIKGSESWNARGRLLIARGLIEGRLEPEEGLLDRLFSCNSCGACEVVCPATVKIVEALRALRKALVARGVRPPAKVWELAENIRSYGSPWPSQVARGGPGGRGGEVLLFTGCVASRLEPGVVEALEAILEAAGVPYSILEGPCCGGPLFRMGLIDQAEEAASRLADEMRSVGAEVVLTPCPTCAEALRAYYPALTGLKVRVEHTTTFLRELLRTGRLVLKRKVELKAVYHDPCVLARSLGIIEAPREVLWSTGLTLIEMPDNKLNTACCGYGQLGFLTYPDLAKATAERRVKEALGMGADVLVSACPSCLHAFSEAVKEVARALAVSDITEVLAELV